MPVAMMMNGPTVSSASIATSRTPPSKPIGTAFVALIKMMISPVIFCTIVLGIGSIRKAATVGKVGAIALEELVRLDGEENIEVAGGAAAQARFALGQVAPDPLADGRHAHRATAGEQRLADPD